MTVLQGLAVTVGLVLGCGARTAIDEDAEDRAGGASRVTDVVEVAAGSSVACALRETGTVLCWGSQDRLGDPSIEDDYRPVPGAVVGLDDAAQIDTHEHTCAVRNGGGVSCWGSNRTGAVGDAGPTAVRQPLDVAGLGEPAVRVATGCLFTCTVLASGRVACWGDNRLGQLGDGSTSIEPRPTPALVSELDDVVAVAGGGFPVPHPMPYHPHVCAVLGSRSVACWGSNVFGQLGDGTQDDSPMPVEVAELDDAVDVRAGNGFTCALRRSGRVWCWGIVPATCSLYSDAVSCEASSVPVEIASLSDVVGVDAGYHHACAVRADGRAFCWGWNTSGELGDGTEADSREPVAVRGLDDIVQVTAGWGFSCALRRDGAVLCWGTGYDGQLGDGTTESSPLPVRVVGLGPPE